MGVKTKIKKSDLPIKYQKYKLIKSKNGATDTVYFLDKKYVLKIFENNTKEHLQNELELLKLCKTLKVSQIKKKIFYIKNKPAFIYKKCNGSNLTQSTKKNIKQIAIFLKEFHKITRDKTNSNKKLFTKSRLKNIIDSRTNKEFLYIFNSLDIKLKNDGLIHGDIFLDNCNFKKNKLKCVYDFSDACVGDFIFDLAVIAQSWCKNDKDIKILLKYYGYKNSLKKFKNYMKYALLYYSVTRYLDNRNYKELLKKMDKLNE
jgi:homoserine kinase type II